MGSHQTMNIRAMGNSIKQRYLREIIGDEGSTMLYIQETKLEVVSKELCYSIWGYNNVDGLTIVLIMR